MEWSRRLGIFHGKIKMWRSECIKKRQAERLYKLKSKREREKKKKA